MFLVRDEMQQLGKNSLLATKKILYFIHEPRISVYIWNQGCRGVENGSTSESERFVVHVANAVTGFQEVLPTVKALFKHFRCVDRVDKRSSAACMRLCDVL